MGTSRTVCGVSGLIVTFVLTSQLIYLAQGSKVWGEVSLPEDLEPKRGGKQWDRLLAESDDEDFAADEPSGDEPSGEEDGSTPEPSIVSTARATTPSLESLLLREGIDPDHREYIYYRALVNFTDSIEYVPELEDILSSAFEEISAAIVDTLESEYNKIPGTQTVNVVLIKKLDGFVFVELDVGSENNSDEEEIRSVLYSVVLDGSIASYVTSVEGFQFRRLGAVHFQAAHSDVMQMRLQICLWKDQCSIINYCFMCSGTLLLEDGCKRDVFYLDLIPRPDYPSLRSPPISLGENDNLARAAQKLCIRMIPSARTCMPDEFTCQDGECVPLEYRCDNRLDCHDMSDELDCRTPSPCEPNEFKCQNGRCALKLWRCDGDNDCGDNSDESYCPTKRPDDACAPEEFMCLGNRACIPASYQCDEEADCSDRSDEIGCSKSSPRGRDCTPAPRSPSLLAGRGNSPFAAASWGPNCLFPLRILMTSDNGRGTLTIRDVKDADQGAYTCEAINAKGMVFGIPDGVLILKQQPGFVRDLGNCPEGHFSIHSNSRCVPCFCFGISQQCLSTSRYRNQIRLRFTEEEDFKGVNVSFPSRLASPPLSSSQTLIDPEMEEFQLVDLSRRFLILDSYWTLPSQFLGNKIDSYGGSLKYKVRYTLARGETEPATRPDVIIVGNGQRLVYRQSSPTVAGTVNQRDITFTEENWEHSSGRPVTREDLMMTLVNLESISIRTVYDNKMVSVSLSDIVMDTTTVENSGQAQALTVEECRCPPGYSGLSCESCSAGFERVSGGPYLGTCAGCSCNGHANACDPISGYCLNCQHNTEGPRCDKCLPGYFGNPQRGRPDDCKPCPCPYSEISRRFSDTCFIDTDGQATCDNCLPGYTGRRCERCAAGYQGNPLQPNGKCVPVGRCPTCDSRGVVTSSSRLCTCKPNVIGAFCDECKIGTFHLTQANPEGCLQCFCMGVTSQCASSSWSRDQVGPTRAPGFSKGNRFYSPFSAAALYLILETTLTDQGYPVDLMYTIRYEPGQRSRVIEGSPDVVLQGNGIFLEHFSQTKPVPRVPTTITVPLRESAWKRADGHLCTREHLLMALADTTVFMIRATYADSMSETSIADIRMDIAVPHPTGQERALEVEECACPQGYKGPSCQVLSPSYTVSPAGSIIGTLVNCHPKHRAQEVELENSLRGYWLCNTRGTRHVSVTSGQWGSACTAVSCCASPSEAAAWNERFSRTCFLDSDGQPTCDNCPSGFTGRRCERCASGFIGNPQLGQRCYNDNELSAGSCSCDSSGSVGCDSSGKCKCKMHTEGPTCGSCKQGHFHLSADQKDGCLSCFCMGVTQQCTSSSYYRDVVSTTFAPGNFQNFALVNRQRSTRITTGFTVEVATDGTQLSYSNFGSLSQEASYWQLPVVYQGDKVRVGSYGGRLKYTISYVAGPRGSPVEDADVQIIGNDITLVARQPWPRGQSTRESRSFEVVFREEHWHRPDGMPATREHLMMVLADLDEILIRASHHTEMRSVSISGVSMEVAVPAYTGLRQALEVEHCRCPPGYQGLSCQDCAHGYSRTGGGLYLGHCELCDCNGHSESCHPETGVCTNCLHNTVGELCEQCAPGFYGDPTAGTPEDCQPCACPHTDPDSQFSPTCESLGNGGYRCTDCQPGYTGQYCERCAPGYVGNPQEREKCRPYNAASLVVKVYPERTIVSQGSAVTLRCQVTGSPPHYFFWTREDGRPLPSTADKRRQGEELFFSNIQPSDAGAYICTCRDLRSSNRSRAEIVVTTVPSKPIEVTVEEPKVQTVKIGSTVSFICTAKSKSPAYTLVWTRQNNSKLPSRAMDFNGILTIHNVQPEDAGAYVCTGSNMFAMDEGTAFLYVPVANEESQPFATIQPPVLRVQRGQRAEFRCTVRGNPTPSIEWAGGRGNRITPKAIIRDGVLIIPAAERSDEAEYICKALNVHGEHTARAVLYVHSASLPHIQVSPPRVTIQEGETLRLYCRAGGTPSPSLTWKKQGGELPPQARMERTDIGTLLIPSIKASDAGTYLCVGTNSIGSSEAPIEVSVLRVDRVVAPVIQPSKATVQEGRTLELSCVVTGSPPPSITWLRSSGPLSANHQVVGSKLRILHASPADSGDYICQVNSGHPQGVTQQSVISVTVTSSPASTSSSTSSSSLPPQVTVTPKGPVRVKVGEPINLECQATGEPRPAVTWHRSDTARRIVLSSPVPMDSNAVMQILAARPEDSGTYGCMAKNSEGSSEVKVDVVVEGGPLVTSAPIASAEAPLVIVVEGDTTTLHCTATGHPPPTITWSKLRAPLPWQHKVVNNSLILPNVGRQDSGQYICNATNTMGTAEITIIVDVESVSCCCLSFPPFPPNPLSPSLCWLGKFQGLDLNEELSPEAPETIELEMRSTSTDGLVFWQGVELGENGKGKDFVSLGLENGYLVFSYQLGSGEAEIRSEVLVNDGKWHKITAVRNRTGRQGSIQIDGGQPVRGESEGRNVMVDTKGNIYLEPGGAPDIATLTGGKFASGITGCLKNLVLMNAQPGEQP
uniref:Heparan sulfate proteoglycan 2 n=1 Tax=Lepisosteus oculatus TaxID=7918 RepID=W5M153_LEPOC